MSIKIDNINQSILRLLQEDTRLSIAAIADSAGISTSPCQKRIKQLESQGVITNYSAHIEVSKICSSVTFLAEITLQEHDKNAFQQFEKVIIEEDRWLSAIKYPALMTIVPVLSARTLKTTNQFQIDFFQSLPSKASRAIVCYRK